MGSDDACIAGAVIDPDICYRTRSGPLAHACSLVFDGSGFGLAPMVKAIVALASHPS
jgi:hypothetical protein